MMAHMWLHRLGFVQGAVSEWIEQLRSLFMLRHTRDLRRTGLWEQLLLFAVIITLSPCIGYLQTNRTIRCTAGQPLFRRTPGAADNLRPRENVPPVLHACIYPSLQDTVVTLRNLHIQFHLHRRAEVMCRLFALPVWMFFGSLCKH